jgi:hypothetical protein
VSGQLGRRLPAMELLPSFKMRAGAIALCCASVDGVLWRCDRA